MLQLIQICGEYASFPTPTTLTCSRIFIINGQALILGRMSKQSKITSFTANQKGRQYLCIFMRYLDTAYKATLEHLITSINVGESFDVINLTIALFKVVDYQSITSFISYYIADAVYGEEILLIDRERKSLRAISNLFKQNGKNFYFVDNEAQQKNEEISEIVDRQQQKIYGFCIRIGILNFCLPLKQLLFNTSTPFSIKQNVEKSLKNVVYLSHDSSHCTGMLISPKLILTVRHLFNVTPPKIGTFVKARFYPYNELKKAKVVLTSTKFIDLMVLETVDEQTNTQNTQKTLNLQQYIKELPKAQKIGLGQKVYAIGFGKHPYLDFHFQSLDILLPTITLGVISKTIPHKGSSIYFKTDCSLYNGYSGCAIWQDGAWVGNTVFIIKNKVSLDKHARHNFSYTCEFVQLFLRDWEGFQMGGQLQEFVRMFEAIHTRKELRVKAKL